MRGRGLPFLVKKIQYGGVVKFNLKSVVVVLRGVPPVGVI
jgi:hypothetical protein